MPAAKAPTAEDTNTLSEHVETLWPEIGKRLRNHIHLELRHATYRSVALRTYHKERAIWVGDAAHGMSPQLG